MLARIFEEKGLATTAFAMVREHAEKVKPPRALFVPFPFGFTLGKPNDPDLQHRVLNKALDLLKYENGPVLADFPEEETPSLLHQASMIASDSYSTLLSAADEVTAMRPFYERWVGDHKGGSAVGLSGISQQRFRGVVHFLEEYANGEDTDMTERPSDIPLTQFLRHCVDDLKAFFYEARMAQHLNFTETSLHEWFWGQTAVGQLIITVADRMKATGGHDMEYLAYGIVR